MKTNELLGIDPLPNLKVPDKPWPFFGLLALVSPFIFTFIWYLIYKSNLHVGGDAWGFGRWISLTIGQAIGSLLGIMFAFMAIIRNEKVWWLFLVALLLNIPSFLFAGKAIAELLKL